MPAQPRSSEGCWTCRLRRKKCDETKPVCTACEALDISCLYSDEKPDWMDGAERQKQKGEEIKAEVKIKAAWRRERKYLQSIESGFGDLSVASTTDAEMDSNEKSGAAPAQGSKTTTTTTTTVDGSPGASSSESARRPESASPPSLPSQSQSSAAESQSSNPPTSSGTEQQQQQARPHANAPADNERELNFVMTYLDYVFPFLFPFYKPTLLESGRGWLLVLLMRKKTLFHSANSLAGYFFSVVADSAGVGAHRTCRRHAYEELERQQELTLRELQADIGEVNARGGVGTPQGGSPVGPVRTMASIVQLLIFEMAVRRTGNWQMHLDGASVLFEQIMEHHALVAAPDNNNNNNGGNSHYCWYLLLTRLGGDSGGDGNGAPYSSDQAAMRFFTALLLLADVVSSTALGQPPRLLRFHASLLEEPERGTPVPVNLAEVVGVQNWAVLCIGQTAALHAWKRDLKDSGTLPCEAQQQLVAARAAQIEARLRGQIGLLDLEELRGARDGGAHHSSSSSNSNGNVPTTADPLDFVAQYDHHGLPPASNAARIAWTSRIWAQAALTYLEVVVSGWQQQQQSSGIRDSVAVTIRLLLSGGTAAPGSLLRTVVWPFCVTGCLALPEQEHVFRELARGVGALSAFGTVGEALGIMESTWVNRADIETCADWSLATSLRTLGTGVILM